MAFKGFDLTGKVAVVVGGTSGIGRAITCGLADAGADIVPTSRRREEVLATAADVESRGKKAVRVTSDVTDVASLEAARRHPEGIGSGHPRQLCGTHQEAAHPRHVEEDWNAIPTRTSRALRLPCLQAPC
jgi:shikimate 5-dehydrogenase